jgi:primase-polymerase (primpol)-like protein
LVTGFRARSNDPGTWCEFDTAISALERLWWLDGLAFALGNRITGLDLDGVRDPVTGELLPWARDVVRTVNSDTEISVSGRGLHIYVYGTLPEGYRHKRTFDRTSQLEIYTRQYFVVTGNHLAGTPTTVEDRSEALRLVYAKYFGAVEPEKASTGVVTSSQSPPQSDLWVIDRCAKSYGAKFLSVFNNTSGHNPSSGDLALLNYLAFYTQDPVQLDRLFRSSSRYRPKWDEIHSKEDTTYGRMTIDKAIAGLRSTYHPWRPK